MEDHAQDLARAVEAAASEGRALEIIGGGTKRFYGRIRRGEPLPVHAHRGVVSYEPTELVITARAGTRLDELEATLADAGQMLAFEPPHFGTTATLGGTIACGLSGPARPHRGAARDFVLGVKCISGRGEVLTFGGQVMKNVAGYDVSRLMAGAMGTLGVLLEVSLKVLPMPKQHLTLMQPMAPEVALDTMNRWASHPWPVSAACYDGEFLYVRLSGAPQAVEAARRHIGGDTLRSDEQWWQALREHHHEFFGDETPLWRLSVPANAPALDLPGPQFIEWGGAQRWVKTDAPGDVLRNAAAGAGGHAALFRGGDKEGDVFHPQPPPLRRLTERLKHAFDPEGILNPGRLYRAL